MIERSSAVLAVLISAHTAAHAARPVLTPDGIGPIRIGMTLQQVQKAVGGTINLHDDASDDQNVCAETDVPGWPNVSLLLENLRVTVISIGKPYRTRDGVGIGWTEPVLKQIFGSHAVFGPRPYFEDDPHAHNVIVKVSKNREFLFQTKDSKIESISLGELPSVEYWEGCA
ncbi:MAG: hypothetical protein JOZ13_03735 [Alphaproteobacteria bacterium]|nr:hypothetical protein [Alphaproteobacteria bacterium]